MPTEGRARQEIRWRLCGSYKSNMPVTISIGRLCLSMKLPPSLPYVTADMAFAIARGNRYKPGFSHDE